jgi:hypothetical protein
MDCDTEQRSSDTRWDREFAHRCDERTEEPWQVTLVRHRASRIEEKEQENEEALTFYTWWNGRPPFETPDVESKFRSLTKTWRTETEHMSQIARKVANPSYLEIIKLGIAYPTTVIPLILKELRKRPAFWFAALETITGEHPCKDHSDPTKERLAWLTWAKRRGHL